MRVFPQTSEFSLNESSYILNFRLLYNCSEYEPLDLVTFP